MASVILIKTLFVCLTLLTSSSLAGLPIPTPTGQRMTGLEPNRTYLVVVTDPHGFYSGHRHNEKYTADYASLSSFADKLREQSKSIAGCEVFFFENGDMVDGGGLTDEVDGKKLTFPILDQIGFDARTLGNHELYVGDTLKHVNFPGAFVTSNVVDAVTKKPFGPRFKIIQGTTSPKAAMVFGFLYDMQGNDKTVSRVETVEDSVKAEWFADALKRLHEVKFVVVLAHMDYRDHLVRVILQAIRKQDATIPVVFVTGHTHVRKSTHLDANAFSFETGRFMDTVGLLSFPSNPSSANSKEEHLSAFVKTSLRASSSSKVSGQENAHEDVRDAFASNDETPFRDASPANHETLSKPSLESLKQEEEARQDDPFVLLDFKHDYLDANKEVLFRFVDSDEETAKAQEIRAQLRQVRKQLSLDKIIGYSPNSYSIQVGLDHPLSLVRYWVERVVPAKLLESREALKCDEGFFLGGSGTLRYDLLRGPVVVDDIWAIDPFQEGFLVVRCVPATILLETIARLPTKLTGELKRPFHPSLPLFVHTALDKVVKGKSYDLVFGVYESEMVMRYLNMNSAKTQFAMEPYREDEKLNGHTMWIRYFTGKKLDDNENEGVARGEVVTAVA